MDAATIKGRLHEYIDQADIELLYAIYILLGKKEHSTYDKSTLDLLYKRLERDDSGESASYSKEEALEYIRSHKPIQ